MASNNDNNLNFAKSDCLGERFKNIMHYKEGMWSDVRYDTQ